MVRDTGPGSYFNIFYTPDSGDRRRDGAVNCVSWVRNLNEVEEIRLRTPLDGI